MAGIRGVQTRYSVVRVLHLHRIEFILLLMLELERWADLRREFA